MNDSKQTIEPGSGVTLILRVEYPTGAGPSHLVRLWGECEEMARLKVDLYKASLPAGCTATQVERRIGR